MFNPCSFNLQDVYRTYNKEKTDYTYHKSRIDTIYVSDHLIIKKNFIQHGTIFSNHKTVEIGIELDQTKLWGNRT